MPAYMDILNALAAVKVKFQQNKVKKTELGGISKIKGASTIRNALKKLKDFGWIVYNDDSTVSITEEGMEKADIDDIDIPTSNEEHHDQVRSEIKKSDVAMFDALLDGLPHDKEELRESLGMKKNSTWRNMVARFVNSYKIAYYPEPKTIRMTKKMFPVVPRPGPDDRNEK